MALIFEFISRISNISSSNLSHFDSNERKNHFGNYSPFNEPTNAKFRRKEVEVSVAARIQRNGYAHCSLVDSSSNCTEKPEEFIFLWKQ